MSNISTVTNSRETWSRTIDATGPSPTPTPAAASDDGKITYHDALERLPAPSVGLDAVVARMDPVGAKLDQARASATGAYTVNGATVYAGIQFRMGQQGFNADAVKDPDTASTLARVAASVGLAGKVTELQSGRGDPADIVRVTKALIADGQLQQGSTKPVADQIHDLQWRFAIGLDCAGYVYRALAAVHGDPAKLGLKPSGYENFTGLPQNKAFAGVDVAHARAGDVMVLGGQGMSARDPGHNLILRSHATLDSASKAAARWPGAADFLVTEGTVHMFEVDSSFGAGKDGNPHGGVRRDTLLYDSTTKKWLTCRDTTPPLVTLGDVPYGELALTGLFRPKAAP